MVAAAAVIVHVPGKQESIDRVESRLEIVPRERVRFPEPWERSRLIRRTWRTMKARPEEACGI